MSKKDKKKKSKKNVLKCGKVLEGGKFKTSKAVLSFPKLFKPEAFNEGKPKFKCSLIWDDDEVDLTLLKKVGKKAVKDWGKKVPKNFIYPWRDGEEREQTGYGEGKTFMNVSSEFPVLVIDKNGDKITDESEIYAGCIVRAIVAPFVYEKPKKGLSFALLAVQKLADGDPLGTMANADDFGDDDLSEFEDDEDDGDDDDDWD